MSNFLASLVARNLGDGARVPEGSDGTVRPRSPVAFEPGGSGAAAEPGRDEVTETPIAPVPESAPGIVPPTRITVPEPAVQPALPAQASSERDHAEPPLAETPIEAEKSPVPSELSVRPKLSDAPPLAAPQKPASTPLEPVPESAVRVEKSSARSAADPPLTGAPTVAEKLPVPSELSVRPKLSDAPLTTKPHRAESTASVPSIADSRLAEQPAAPRGRRSDPLLERIVRQMVLSPRPDSAAPPTAESLTLVKAERPSSSELLTNEPSAPPSLEPQLAALDIRFAEAPTPTPQLREVRRLSPVPAPPRLPDQPAETTVRIKIGRIEVRTGAERPTETTPRPKRPQAELMSLDDYLTQRAKEG